MQKERVKFDKVCKNEPVESRKVLIVVHNWGKNLENYLEMSKIHIFVYKRVCSTTLESQFSKDLPGKYKLIW